MLSIQQTSSSDNLGGFAIWRGLKTPGDISAKIDEVNTYIQSLGRDIYVQIEKDCQGVNWTLPMCKWYRFLDSWSEFYHQWDRFRTQQSSYWERMWGDSWDHVLEYQERAIAWQQTFQTLGGNTTGPDIPDPKRHDIPWRGIIIAGVAIAGVFAGAKLLGVARTYWRKRKLKSA